MCCKEVSLVELRLTPAQPATQQKSSTSRMDDASIFQIQHGFAFVIIQVIQVYTCQVPDWFDSIPWDSGVSWLGAFMASAWKAATMARNMLTSSTAATPCSGSSTPTRGPNCHVVCKRFLYLLDLYLPGAHTLGKHLRCGKGQGQDPRWLLPRQFQTDFKKPDWNMFNNP